MGLFRVTYYNTISLMTGFIIYVTDRKLTAVQVRSCFSRLTSFTKHRSADFTENTHMYREEFIFANEKAVCLLNFHLIFQTDFFIWRRCTGTVGMPQQHKMVAMAFLENTYQVKVFSSSLWHWGHGRIIITHLSSSTKCTPEKGSTSWTRFNEIIVCFQ